MRTSDKSEFIVSSYLYLHTFLREYADHPTTLMEALKASAKDELGDPEEGRLRIIVRRASALKDALQNIARAQKRLCKPLSVRFIGESAIDDGGPTRELASEVMKQFTRSTYVQG